MSRCQFCRTTRHTKQLHKEQPPRRCYICSDAKHITSACPKRAVKENWTVNLYAIDTTYASVNVECQNDAKLVNESCKPNENTEVNVNNLYDLQTNAMKCEASIDNVSTKA